MPQRPGFELPLLLLGGFKAIVEELHAELAARGHDQARPIHGFALQAIGPEGATVSELGRRLGVSKQAAAKTAASLEAAGYAERAPHPEDRRAWVLSRTARGTEMLELSAGIFEGIRRGWSDRLGAARVQAMEDDLATMTRAGTARSLGDLPGWFR